MSGVFWGLLALTAGVLFAVPLSAWLERRALDREKEAYERFVGTSERRHEVHPSFDPWSRRV